MPRVQLRAGRTLVFVGDTHHFHDNTGRLYTHGALAAQLDLWANQFDRVIFCGLQCDGPPPASFARYASPNIELVPLRAAGGSGWRARLGIVAAAFSWIRVLVPVLRRADAVHLRTPCNVALVGIPLARALVKNRYAIFAGSWESYHGEPTSYRIQRWMLRRPFAGVVHAYVTEDLAGSVRRAFSPVLSDDELSRVASIRLSQCDSQRPGVDRPLRLVSVGRFSENKNQLALIGAIRALADAGIHVEARLIGDGPTHAAVMGAAHSLEDVRFIPVASRSEVFDAMAWADLNVLPSFREGYPKVLLEGMSAGALPVAADRPVNRSMVEGAGWVFDPSKPTDLVAILQCVVELDQHDWAERRVRCRAYAGAHTLDAFGLEVDEIVTGVWGLGVDLA